MKLKWSQQGHVRPWYQQYRWSKILEVMLQILQTPSASCHGNHHLGHVGREGGDP